MNEKNIAPNSLSLVHLEFSKNYFICTKKGKELCMHLYQCDNVFSVSMTSIYYTRYTESCKKIAKGSLECTITSITLLLSWNIPSFVLVY